MSERERMLRCLSAAQFAQWEAHLFLDTHPTDQQALAAHCDYAAKADALKERYEACYGSLTGDGCESERWSWVNDPWPWDYIG